MAAEKTKVNNEAEELTAEKVNEIFQIRRDKLKNLKETGKIPSKKLNMT
ncbi:MAG: hypothetical protein IKW18_02025 [Clostridia bacterium]|nr:hypothetical protein [Clostridia bacterium]